VVNKLPYFDNAATTYPKPEVVYAFTDKFYREYGVNVGRGQHKLASTAGKLREDTRGLLLGLFHCPAKKAMFTHTATEAINIILQGLDITDNKTIYLSPFEHNAVTRVIHHLQSIYKLNVQTLAVDKDTLEYDLGKIKYQFNEYKPHFVVVSHASNVCGVIAPIKEICELSKKHTAVNIIDMAQTAGLIDTDLSSTIYDFAVFAGHKTLYAPFGIAGFICNGDISPKPLLYGGTGNDSGNQYLPSKIPDMYEVGSPNIAAIAGLTASLNWIKEMGIENIYATERKNHDELLNVLYEYKNVKIIRAKDKNNSVGIVSCLFEGFTTENDTIGQILSERDIYVRTGLHCAPLAHKFLETFPAGTVRFSVSFFNKKEDFESLSKALRYIADNS
jgi:cysteine desulfurase family protein